MKQVIITAIGVDMSCDVLNCTQAATHTTTLELGRSQHYWRRCYRHTMDAVQVILDQL